ncbi:MAG: hypothetical protein HQL93_13100 [Magnetococcales bacterium]|nr:hypothetical protein [Magnetococcales bacterium]
MTTATILQNGHQSWMLSLQIGHDANHSLELAFTTHAERRHFRTSSPRWIFSGFSRFSGKWVRNFRQMTLANQAVAETESRGASRTAVENFVSIKKVLTDQSYRMLKSSPDAAIREIHGKAARKVRPRC